MFENILKGKMKICKYSRNNQKRYEDALRRLERVFFVECSVCETMKDYKEGFNGVGKLYVSLELYCCTVF